MASTHQSINVDICVPLVVALDGTLLTVDTLHEQFALLLVRRPMDVLRALRLFCRRRAAGKKYLAGNAELSVQRLPLRLDLLELLRGEAARGRSVHLVTAADQKVADAVAAWLGIFKTAVGSDGTNNLKGARKCEYLSCTFPNGFIYAGDATAEYPIFAQARAAILCDLPRSAAKKVMQLGTPVIAEFRGSSGGIVAWVRALRVHQWTKNLLLFVPLILGHAYGEIQKIAVASLAFVVLCVMTSATYIVNDLLDINADRGHPTKRLRPFASGQLSVSQGFVASLAMIAVALSSGFALSQGFGIAILGYLLLTLAYSLGLKRLMLQDTFIIAALFTFRIVMGTAVLEQEYSKWLLTFSFVLFLSLALVKRNAELRRLATEASRAIEGRGYMAGDWPLTLAFGVCAGGLSIVILLLYLANDAAPSGFYHALAWLYVAPAALGTWLMRLWSLSHRAELHDDPIVFALTDPFSLAALAVVAAAFILAI
jgi:4-hydroxybenzoate polyprenyltransferase